MQFAFARIPTNSPYITIFRAALFTCEGITLEYTRRTKTVQNCSDAAGVELTAGVSVRVVQVPSLFSIRNAAECLVSFRIEVSDKH